LDEREAIDIEMHIGPDGEIYSESEDEDAIEAFIPRCKLAAYHFGEGENLRVKKRNPHKFTRGTDPRTKEIMGFMLDESIGCPQYLPLDEDDAKLTNVVIEAAIVNPHIPLSEHIRKENFFKFFQGFNQAILADPALIKTEILHKLTDYNMLHGLH
jgi:hypothetical protein